MHNIQCSVKFCSKQGTGLTLNKTVMLLNTEQVGTLTVIILLLLSSSDDRSIQWGQ